MLSLNNGKVYLSKEGLCSKSLLIKDGKIKRISNNAFKEGKIIDCKSHWILPGAIDPHVHFRIPGNEEKEDWQHGSMAAVSGGVTTVLDMPNTNPPTTTKKALEDKVELASRDSLVNFGFHFGVTKDNLKEIKSVLGKVAGLKVYFGSSTGNLLVSDPEYLKKVLNVSKGKVICFHAEDDLIMANNRSRYGDMTDETDILDYHEKLRDKSCAYNAVSKILDIFKSSIKTRIYFCHVSTYEEIKLINKFKMEGGEGDDELTKHAQIYTEVSPHHLFLSKEKLQASGKAYLAKVNPPIRSAKDQEILYKSFLASDTNIDLIGTDHAPHLASEKRQTHYNKIPSGLPGLESFIPLLLDQVNKNKISIKRFVDITSTQATKIFKIENKGFIKEGFDADLMIVDPSMSYIMSDNDIYTKAKWNIFLGHKFSSRIVKTIVGGEVVFSHEEGFPNLNKAFGKEINFFY